MIKKKMRLSGKSMLNSVENKHSIRNIKNKAKRLIEFDHADVLTADIKVKCKQLSIRNLENLFFADMYRSLYVICKWNLAGK